MNNLHKIPIILANQLQIIICCTKHFAPNKFAAANGVDVVHSTRPVASMFPYYFKTISQKEKMRTGFYILIFRNNLQLLHYSSPAKVAVIAMHSSVLSYSASFRKTKMGTFPRVLVGLNINPSCFSSRGPISNLDSLKLRRYGLLVVNVRVLFVVRGFIYPKFYELKR